MKNNFSYLNDKTFLNKISEQKVKNHYAKIMLLDYKTETFYKEYVGRVTGGSVTLSATSAVRRTCNLTTVADEEENDFSSIESDISINKKFQLLVGYDNEVPGYANYGDIIWFPLGIFVFTSVALSRSASGITINITGEDKMCLLNGDIAGALPANTTFHERQEYKADGSVEVTSPTIFQIIQESVNHLGGESLNNIVINDLPLETKMVAKYTGNTPLYYGSSVSSRLEGAKIFSLNKNDLDVLEKTYVKGDIIGYLWTDFTFPKELILDAGASVADVLQNIKSVLSNYEYFYDKEGVFHFQEIKNYLNTSYVPLIKIDNTTYTSNFSESSKSVFTFDESDLVISYNNNVNYKNVKNDFCVWGELTNKDKSKLAILYHLAIDEKPECQMHKVIKYKDDKENILIRIPTEEDLQTDVEEILPADWRYELYLQALERAAFPTIQENYDAELLAYFPNIYDFGKNNFKPEVLEDPSTLLYWLDFVTPDSIVGKYSIDRIGKRTKAETDTDVTRIYTKDIEDVVLLNKTDYTSESVKKSFNQKCMEFRMDGQKYAEIDDDLYKLITPANQPLTAYDKVRELLFQYTYLSDMINLSCMPLYFLEPNQRITVNNKASGIYGDFIIQSITLPLGVTGQMNLSATRATTRL